MSSEQLEAVIGRAINDVAFRDLLASNPGSALAGYDLSDDERALLADAQGKDFDELLMGLEDRVSKTGLLGGVSGGDPRPDRPPRY